MRAVSTEGLRYSVFRREAGEAFKGAVRAYLNLTRLVSDYPLLGPAGAKEALSVMASDWNSPVDV